MRENWVKRKLQAGEPSFGAWLSLGDRQAAKILVRAGFDWLLIDLEHSPIDWSCAAALVDTVAEAGAVPIVRVPEGTHSYIKRALDAGAWGIMVPMVNTVEQARAAIAAAKFPPTGTRSVGSFVPMLSFDATTSEYVERANDELLVVLQIESPQGIAHLAEICRLPGCDVVFIGAFDLWQHLPCQADGSRPPREALEGGPGRDRHDRAARGPTGRYLHAQPGRGPAASGARDADDLLRHRREHAGHQGPGGRREARAGTPRRGGDVTRAVSSLV